MTLSTSLDLAFGVALIKMKFFLLSTNPIPRVKGSVNISQSESQFGTIVQNK